MHRDFEHLYQEGMTKTLYDIRFTELERHAVFLVPNKRERVRSFIEDLYFGIWYGMPQEAETDATIL